MEKQFCVDADDAVVLVAANEEFASAPALPAAAWKNNAIDRGWSAYEIWHRRIRLLPGVTSLFLLQA